MKILIAALALLFTVELSGAPALAADVFPEDQARALELLQPTGTTKRFGNWVLTREADIMSDRPRTMITLDGVTQDGRSVAFMGRCDGGETSALLLFAAILGNDGSSRDDGYKVIQVRFNGEPAEVMDWPLVTDRAVRFLGWDEGFLKRMMGHDWMLVRTTPRGDAPVTAAFILTGMRPAVEALADDCGWREKLG